MRNNRRILCVAVPVVLAAALACSWLFRAPKISASLYELIGREAERIPSFVREASASDIAIVVSSADAILAERTANKIRALPIASAAHELPPGALDFIRANRGGLVSREQAELLTTRAGRTKLAKRALRRLVASPVPPLLGYADDPFRLTDSFLMSVASRASAVSVTNGITRILVKCRVDRETSENLDKVISGYSSLRTLVDRLSVPGVEIRFAGAPVHAALSAAKSKSEIGWLTWFSLAFIAGLAVIVFRSWKWIPLLASSLAISALAGCLAWVWFFRDLHVMTLVMGTTVLGLVIDYSFHWLLSPSADKPSVRQNLLVSFLTTEISLIPLMLASIPVLRQSAVFLGVGLAAALGYVLLCYPSTGRAHEPSLSTSAFPLHFPLRIPLMVFAGFAITGIFRASIRTDLTALYRPPAELIEAERQRAEFGEFDFTAMPSLEQRQEIAANVNLLYAEQGQELAKTLQMAMLPRPPAPTDAFVRPKALMEDIFATWTADALRRLALSVVALLAVLVLLCRRRAFKIFLPPFVALLSVAGLLGWIGTSLNLFHILAMFLLLGMGIDYSVFLQSGNRSAMRPAVSSLLTSMAGFGALAFVSFPVVASFGVVLGLGLPLSFLFASVVIADGGHPFSGRGQKSVSTQEHGANLFGLHLLFAIYRLTGLELLHFLSSCTGVCIWLCSPAVRRAAPSLRKLVNFTRSLADKLVVMGEGRSLPRVETDGSDDARSFLDDVQSGRGVFVLSSHVGTIEVLTALGACDRQFHAWMDFDRTSVFNRFYLRHAKRRRVTIHPISEFGMQTVFEAGDAIDAGDCLVMAGDRGEGAFRFAAAFEHPVYFVACLAESGCRYRVVVRRLPSDRHAMKREYEKQLQDLSVRYPHQHFVWNAEGGGNVVK